MEIWKDIKGWEGYYQVSNLGRIRSLDRNIYCKSKNQYTKFDNIHKFKGQIIKPNEERNGYYQVHLCKHSKKKWMKVHRLVAEAFISNPDNLLQINHIDGNKKNNNVINLEYCTQSENITHAYKNGLIKPATSSIKMYDLNMNYIKTFNSIGDAAKYINRASSSIVCNLLKKTKQCGGYIFKYDKKKNAN